MANYRISELDFDEIKINLKQFLINYRDKNKNLVFKDYDFEASSLSILLDLLSYNTHYNAYLANMVANEMFLDSAVKRESAVSISKHLGYTPLSYRSAKAQVSFTISNPAGNPTTLTLPKFSPFSTIIDGTLYTFVNLDAVTISPVNDEYLFSNVELVEGQPLNFTYRVDASGPDEKYSIPNNNIDTSTIRVVVQNSYSDTTQTTYTVAGNLEALTGQSQVYFIEESPTGYYEIFFGDGVLGKKLSNGNLVRIEYLVSNGSKCNVSSDIDQEFSLQTNVGGVNLEAPIIASRNSTGGDEADNLEEIKFKAPRFLSSFNRAVTANDYKAIIESNYPLVESISVWGGEENIPPVYGKVFISLKPYSGYTINTELKEMIKREILADRKMMSIIPEFKDPNYLFVTVNAKVKFDPRNSKYNQSEITTLVRAKIEEYFQQELQKFDKDFVYSKLSRAIDSVDLSILGNVVSFQIQKRISPSVNVESIYTGTAALKFANQLVSNTIQSTAFYYRKDNVIYTVYIKDSLTAGTAGILNLYNALTDTILVQNIGTVDYVTGTITIPSLTPAGYYENNNDIRISARITELDIQSSRDLILIIDDSTSSSIIKRSAGLTVTISV